MKAVLQRASKAQVEVDKQVVGKINHGLVVLLCVEQGDGEADCDFIARKCCELRIFEDPDGKMNLSLQDVGGAILLISQFTLAADWKKGRRPGFTKAAHPSEGQRLYEYFAEVLQKLNVHVERGIFGAHMEVSLCNDGPVTLILDHQIQSGTTISPSS
ncbi:MAG: D-tyrosyl-tRNA(Tyr) deacylase [Candidatus Obscuribacterales bacterium]|jgi:D-tyrosyl-tRNA(Tyr) deacylase|nr:D-tyrosyl-tRNA(Tyr) deacylase [Candidatus Obscuribacterales bacterium]